MSISLRSVATGCLGLTGTISVVSDVFGYVFRDGSNQIFGGNAREMRLGRQLALCEGQALNINLILVGEGNFTDTDRMEIQHGIQFMRDIYDDVDIGVRKLDWQQISVAHAGSYTVISSDGEAHDLTDDWNGPPGALDVFIVRVMTHADGVSAVDGPCSKDDKQMTGSVVSLNGSFSNSGNTFAHEIGHYLGLDHVASPTNFIGNDGASNSNTGITSSQGTTMKAHCHVTDEC